MLHNFIYTCVCAVCMEAVNFNFMLLLLEELRFFLFLFPRSFLFEIITFFLRNNSKERYIVIRQSRTAHTHGGIYHNVEEESTGEFVSFYYYFSY